MEDTQKTLAQIIADIQDEVGNIKKDSKNPHFKNTYASYEQVLEVLNPILRKHNLVIYHGFGEPIFENQIAVTTEIVNTIKNKGISTTLYIPVSKLDPQMAGSAITYAKRYSILAMLGLGTEDDDAEGAVVRPQKTNANSYATGTPLTGQITREPVENAVDTGLISRCRDHDVEMIQKISAKTGNPYWSHRNSDGTLCFGKVQR